MCLHGNVGFIKNDRRMTVYGSLSGCGTSNAHANWNSRNCAVDSLQMLRRMSPLVAFSDVPGRPDDVRSRGKTGVRRETGKE